MVGRAESNGSSVKRLPPLTLGLLQRAAREFASELSKTPLISLYGVTDGKAIGTCVEDMFKEYLKVQFDFTAGSPAKGLDFPTLNLDLKVTSKRQPQSSCPFKSVAQKIYGLGYHLLVFVYEKRDNLGERAAYLEVSNVVYIDASRTGDYTLTKAIREIVASIGEEGVSREAVIDDLDALLQDKNIPLDEVSLRQLAEDLVREVPEQGFLTISNALQWRLQYNHAINAAQVGVVAPEVDDLRAK